MQNGAQPTETAKRLLSYKGVLLKNHLAGGVRKGALTEEQMEEKFNAWLEDKSSKVESKKDTLSKEQEKAKKEALAAETAANEARIAAAQPEEVAEEAAPEAEAPATEENNEEEAK